MGHERTGGRYPHFASWRASHFFFAAGVLWAFDENLWGQQIQQWQIINAFDDVNKIDAASRI